jgi:amidophosphoribosyltransferase
MFTECGVCGIYSINKEFNINKCIIGLNTIQHRGQEACGIAYYHNKNNFTIVKGFGLVNQNFYGSQNLMYNTNVSKFKNRTVIGHVRYSTSGNKKKDLECVHPIKTNLRNKDNLVFCFNGNIPLLEKLFPNCKTDALAFSKFCTNYSTIERCLIDFITKFHGVYCFVLLYKKELYIFKDRHGVRPLALGIKCNDNNNITSFCVSSETVTFNILNYKYFRDIIPGELTKINKNGMNKLYQVTNNSLPCLFEYIYFLNPNSTFDNIKAENFRNNIGILLAKNESIHFDYDDTIVVGCPNSGIEPAKCFSQHLKLIYKQVIMKNPKINRTFILSTQEDRIKHLKQKFIFCEIDIYKKKIIIVDDSIVRGNTLKILIEQLKLSMPLEIHIRIASPPITDRCFFGIDIPTKEELIYNKYPSEDLLKDYYNINSFKYTKLEDIKEKYNNKNFCISCFNGKYNKDLLEW